jgi:hypothetical protein
MRSRPDLAFRVRVLASVGSPPNLTQDFASLSIRPRTLGSLMNEERRHLRFSNRPSGSCVTSIAGPHGNAQLYER